MLMTNGGAIGRANPTTIAKASCMWSPEEATIARADGRWPVGADPNHASMSVLFNCQDLTDSGLLRDGSGKGHHAKLSGWIGHSARLSTELVQYGKRSVSCSGVGGGGDGGCINVSSNSDFAMGSGDFTVGLRVYFSALPASDVILVDTTDGSGAAGVYIYMDYVGYLYFYSSGAIITISGAACTANAWHYLTWTKNAGVSYMHLDGVSRGPPYTDANTYTQTGLGVGNDSLGRYAINGAIQTFFMLKGVALYGSGSYTPPVGLLAEG
jgi:Concanavalin A-like lectin/glucanases superfamily